MASFTYADGSEDGILISHFLLFALPGTTVNIPWRYVGKPLSSGESVIVH